MRATMQRTASLFLLILASSAAASSSSEDGNDGRRRRRSSSRSSPSSPSSSLRGGDGATSSRSASSPSGSDSRDRPPRGSVGGVGGVGVGGLLSLPLLPHGAVLERRRRALALLGGGDDAAEADLRSAAGEEEDGGRFEGWWRRRRATEGEEEGDGGEDEDGSGGDRRRPPQVGPLYQGYGTHYVDLWVGSPIPQRQTVIVDTGSGITAFPCSGCPKQTCGDGYHTDATFDERRSDTFSMISECGECTLGRCEPTYGLDGRGGVARTGDKCLVTMSYQEGSSWEAYEAEDWAYAGGRHDRAVQLELPGPDEDEEAPDGADPDLAAAYRFELRFACQTLLTGLFRTQLADGIMGMENGESAFWSQIYERYGGVPSRAFSLCFSRGDAYDSESLPRGSVAGALTLGGTDERLHDSPVVYAENVEDRGWYTVRVAAVYLRRGDGADADVAGDAADAADAVRKLEVDPAAINAGGIIVDSGTTDTYFPRALGGAFEKAWRDITGSDPPKPKEAVALSPQELEALPTLLVQLAAASRNLPSDPLQRDGADPSHFPGAAGALDPERPADVLLTIPPAHYMEPLLGGGPDDYSMRMHFTEKNGGVLGANAMMGFDVVFDNDHGRVGFAESTCDYSKVAGQEGEDVPKS